MSTHKNVVLGVCGGIAAYKACDVVSRLKKQEINVDVIMTEAACNFVAPLTFEILSQNKVTTDMFDRNHSWDVEHISLAKKADVFVIAPATANIIGKIANGIADDMLSTTVMATKAKVIIVPAMNTAMYENVMVQENLKKLESLGYIITETLEGRLACGDIGLGKMIEPAEIVEKILDTLEHRPQDLLGKTVIVTAGPTIEALDPVRFITNHSTGKMGFALAESAAKRGAKVYLITGRTNLTASKMIHRIDITSALSMLEAVNQRFEEADIIIKNAAVADYAPAIVSEQKIKKSEDELSLRLKKNPDILYTLGQKKGDKILVGFAMETENLIANAFKKVQKKNLDLIIANDLKTEGAGFAGDTNIVKIIDRNGEIEELPLMSKSALSNKILDRIVDIKRT